MLMQITGPTSGAQDEIAELDAFSERLEVHMKKETGKKTKTTAPGA